MKTIRAERARLSHGHWPVWFEVECTEAEAKAWVEHLGKAYMVVTVS